MRSYMQQNMIGHNIIITEPSSNLRALGRNALAGKWKIAILAYIVYLVCVQLPPAVFDSFLGLNIGDVSSPYDYGTGAVSADFYSQVYNSMPSVSPLSSIYVLIISGPFTLGITIFFLALFRKQEVVITDIFLGFERFGKALGLFLFQGLFIVLWAMIGVAVMIIGVVVMTFTITGGTVIMIIGAIISAALAIIASLKYAQAFFILSDNPDLGIRECVDESKMLMKGNKSKYFLLQLSFIGWIILSCLPMGILSGISEVLQTSPIISVIIAVIAELFLAPVEVYLFSAITGFYEILAGHLIKETEPAPLSHIAAEVPREVESDVHMSSVEKSTVIHETNDFEQKQKTEKEE